MQYHRFQTISIISSETNTSKRSKKQKQKNKSGKHQYEQYQKVEPFNLEKELALRSVNEMDRNQDIEIDRNQDIEFDRNQDIDDESSFSNLNMRELLGKSKFMFIELFFYFNHVKIYN